MTDEQRQALTPISLRRKARDFALKTVKQQAQGFQRWGSNIIWMAAPCACPAIVQSCGTWCPLHLGLLPQQYLCGLLCS